MLVSIREIDESVRKLNHLYGSARILLTICTVTCKNVLWLPLDGKLDAFT
jgi:hypothetical protein